MEDNNFTNCYKYLAIAILVIGFVAGVALGSAFSITTLEEDIYGNPIEKFNVVLMFITWLSSAFLTIICCFMFSVCKRLDTIAIQTSKTNNKNK